MQVRFSPTATPVPDSVGRADVPSGIETVIQGGPTVTLPADALQQIIAAAVDEGVRRARHVAAVAAPCEPGALSEISRATDGGSSATEEEPMYEKIYGPYFKAGKHHVHLHFLDGTKKYKTFGTDEEARAFIQSNERRAIATRVTVKSAVDEYMKTRVDLRESSATTLRFRLEALIRGFEGTYVQTFPTEAAWKKVAGENAVDTQHGIRSAGKAFFNWCMKQGYAKKNPMANIEIVGKKRRGKPQLRLDEARTMLTFAFSVVDGEPLNGRSGSQQQVAVLGAAVALLLGLRNGEVVGRTVRDLDNGGRVLVIDAAKTEAGVRRIEVPDVLGSRLLKLAEGRPSTEQLFMGLTKDGLRYWTQRLCAAAQLPEVTPHGLRGTNATASMKANPNAHQVAAALGHTSITVTKRHYADEEAVAAAQQEAAVEALLPSKNSSKNFGQNRGASNAENQPFAND